MMLFIDESGDSGFKKGASPYFVLTMIAVQDQNVSKIDDFIEDIKKKNGIYPSEYKFSKTSDSHKQKFFTEIAEIPFLAYALVVDKSLIYSNELKKDSKKFYSFFLKQLLQNSPLEIGTKIRIDKSSSKVFQKEAMFYLRKQLDTFNLNIKFLDSKAANLIQLADMVSGAICRKYSHKEKKQLLPYIAKKIKDIWEFK